MTETEFEDLCDAVQTSLNDRQRAHLHELTEAGTDAIVLKIDGNSAVWEQTAAPKLAETIARIGVEQSLNTLKSWEGRRNG